MLLARVEADLWQFRTLSTCSWWLLPVPSAKKILWQKEFLHLLTLASTWELEI